MQYGTSFAYFRDENNFPVTCVAILTVEGSTAVSYGLSTVNPNDRGKYSKSLARHIAEARLVKNPVILRVPEAGMKMGDLLPLIAKDVWSNQNNGQLQRHVAGGYMNP